MASAVHAARGGIKLPAPWFKALQRLAPDRAYYLVRLRLRDARYFDKVIVIGGMITAIRGRREIPFTSGDLIGCRLTFIGKDVT